MRKLRDTREKRRDVAKALSGPEGLIAPLNGAHQSKRSLELMDLVRTLQEIEQLSGLLGDTRTQWLKILHREAAYPVSTLIKLHKKANQILSSCHWSPRITFGTSERNRFAWDAKTKESDWENRFVYWLLNLRAKGQILLVRSCRNCKRWFYATTNHQSFCKDNCRQKFHSGDENFKDRRRLYMEQYRKDLKRRESAARSMVYKSR
jgi:hypothetical protein